MVNDKKSSVIMVESQGSGDKGVIWEIYLCL